MEELRTTEVLDREILEDARKKAAKILKNADDTLATQDRDWEKKIQDAVQSIGNVYAERTKRETDEILARLPLDKRRLRTERAESLLHNAINDFLRGLRRETLLSILERELLERFGDWAGREKGTPAMPAAQVSYSGLSLSETRDLLKRVINKLGGKSANFTPEKTIVENWELKEGLSENKTSGDKSGAQGFPSIVINTQSLKIIASVEEAAGNLLEEKRAELAAALLGEGVLND